MDRRTYFVTLASAAALLASSRDVAARGARVVWTAIEFPPHHDNPTLDAAFRKIIEHEGRHAEWGDHDAPVEASLCIVQLDVSATQEVVRVSAALTGRLHGGRLARSSVSMGAAPRDRAKLERQVLTMLGRGIVTRLAAMSRARAPKRERTT